MAHTRRVTFLLVCFLALSFVAGKKERAVRNSTNNAPKKIRLRTVVARLRELEKTVEDISEKIQRVDSAQGQFKDERPCPVRSAPGFNGSKALGSCYRMEPTSNMMNWTEAQSFCKSLHRKSHLVAIETEKEHKFLKAKWYNECGFSSLARFWTDGTKADREDWSWVTADIAVSQAYTNWITTTTHDDSRYSCLAVYASEAYAWGDVACWAPHVVTCEIEL